MTSTATSQKRYECRWRDAAGSIEGISKHYWVDHYPNEPHWPDSVVMRWDLRQSDWHKIWFELIDHPCAFLFAPRHPDRDGAPRFRDWVESWPEKFEWESQLPEHLHPAILKALSEIASDESLASGEHIQPEFIQPSRPPIRTVEAEDILEQLSVILLEVNDDNRQLIAKHLATLAMAPDSGRVIQALKLAFQK